MDKGELIELVRQYEHIYNKRHKDFKNKLARDNAWKTISSIMKCPKEEVETTWNTLRNRYVTERRKMRCIPTGSAAKTEWYYYQAMSFLEQYIAIRKTEGNIKQNVWDTPIIVGTNDGEESLAMGEESHQHQEMTQNSDESPDEMSQDSNRESMSQSSQSSTQHSTCYRSVSTSSHSVSTPSCAVSAPLHQPTSSRFAPAAPSQHKSNLHEMRQNTRKRKNPVDFEKSIVATLASINDVVKNDSENNDEDMLFGRSIGQSLKIIKNRKLKAKVKLELLSVFEKYELED